MLHPADRPALKRKAKETLRSHSPRIYLVGILCSLLTTIGATATEWPTIRLLLRAESLEEMLYLYENSTAVSTGFALSIATLAMTLFVNLVTYGWQLFSLRASREEETGGAETLFSCFQQFWRFLLAQLLMNLFITLWSLLFVIPGIIAAFAYSQTIYIMLDNPQISPLEAIGASKQLMRGHKFEYFTLQLSFLGWAYLSIFTFGLLGIWLNPYMQVTMANYYNALTGWQPRQAEEPMFSQPEEWWNQ
jgi:uncharacterized membrane protein